MFISAVVNAFVSRRLYRVARQTGSVCWKPMPCILKPMSIHLSGAVGWAYNAYGVVWLDPRSHTCRTPYPQGIVCASEKAFSPLLDSSWEAGEIKELEKPSGMEVNYHDLRTRIAGNYRFIDVHIEITEEESVGNAHLYCDRIEDELKRIYENLTVTIRGTGMKSPSPLPENHFA